MAECKLTTIIVENNQAIIKTTITDKVICTLPDADLEYAKQFSEALIEAHLNHSYHIKHLSELFDELVEKATESNEHYELWFIRNYPKWAEYTWSELEHWIWEANVYDYKIILPDLREIFN